MPGKGQYTRTKKEYLDLIKAKHGDKFSISPFEYNGGETWIEVTCPSHGKFQKKIAKMISDKHGCPKCSREAAGEIRTATKTGVPVKAKWIPVEEAISRIKLPPNIIADFSGYVSWAVGEIHTECSIHGPKIWVNAAALNQSKNRCPECGSAKRSKSRTTTWDEFIDRANEKFSNRFTYSDDYSYSSLKSYVSIICSEHGPQKIRAGKHVVHGQYCAQCRYTDGVKSGLFPGFYAERIPFNPDLASQTGRLYYFQHGTKFKIGITKNPMSERLKGTPDRERVTRVESVEMTLGEALVFEQYALRHFVEHRIARVWTTELFNDDVLLSEGHQTLDDYVAWARENLDFETEMGKLREAALSAPNGKHREKA